MPYKSDRQRGFIEGLASGSITDPDFSQAEAQSFASHSRGPGQGKGPRKAKGTVRKAKVVKKKAAKKAARHGVKKVAKKKVPFRRTMGYE